MYKPRGRPHQTESKHEMLASSPRQLSPLAHETSREHPKNSRTALLMSAELGIIST